MPTSYYSHHWPLNRSSKGLPLASRWLDRRARSHSEKYHRRSLQQPIRCWYRCSKGVVICTRWTLPYCYMHFCGNKLSANRILDISVPRWAQRSTGLRLRYAILVWSNEGQELKKLKNYRWSSRAPSWHKSFKYCHHQWRGCCYLP